MKIIKNPFIMKKLLFIFLCFSATNIYLVSTLFYKPKKSEPNGCIGNRKSNSLDSVRETKYEYIHVLLELLRKLIAHYWQYIFFFWPSSASGILPQILGRATCFLLGAIPVVQVIFPHSFIFVTPSW